MHVQTAAAVEASHLLLTVPSGSCPRHSPEARLRVTATMRVPTRPGNGEGWGWGSGEQGV